MKKWQMIMVIAVGIIALSADTIYGKAAKPIEWKVYFSTMVYQENWQGKIMQAWAQECEERTDGMVHMDLYWPGQLPYKGFEILQTIEKKMVDAAECLTSYYGSTEPLMDPSFQIFQFYQLDEFEEAIKKVVNYHFKPIYDKYNAVPLIQTTSGGSQHWFSSVPVTKMSDMEGIKCRVYNKAGAKMVKSWGCSPITIPIVELYTALQRGVAEAVITSFTTGADVKFWEVLPYATEINWTIGGLNTVLVNKEVWEQLPERYQATLRIVGNKYSHEIFKGQAEQEEKLRALFRKHGVKILDLEPGEKEKLKNACTFLWKEYLDRTGEKGEQLLRDLEIELDRPILSEIEKVM